MRHANIAIMCVCMAILSACNTTTEVNPPETNQPEVNQPEMNQSEPNKFEVEDHKNMGQQLIDAANQGDLDSILTLLNDGVNIDTTDAQGNTAVMAATKKNHVAIVKLLIEHGANINIQNDMQDNVFLYAGAEGLLEIVRLAIAADADPTLTNRYGGTALIPAADRGHVDVVKELLTNSTIDVNHINNLHWTALMEAVILGDGGPNHQQIVQLLVDHGADPQIADRDGITPLQHAMQRNYQEIIRILQSGETN